MSFFFNLIEWMDFWMISNWNNSYGICEDFILLMVNLLNNVYFEVNYDVDFFFKLWFLFCIECF